MKTLIAAAVLSLSAVAPMSQAAPVDLATLTDFNVKSLTTEFIAKQINDIKYSVLAQAEQSLADLTASVEQSLVSEPQPEKAPVVKIIDQTGE